MIVLHQGRTDTSPTWQWVIHLHASGHQNGMRGTNGSAETREEAMTAFRRAFEHCRKHIGAEGWQHHVEHMAMVRARAEGGRKY